MTPLPLLDWSPKAHARAGDRATSHEAASQARGLAQQHSARILGHLVAIRPMGATKDEIAEATGLDSVAVARRMRDLERASLVIDTGSTRRSASGRQATVWRAVLTALTPAPPAPTMASSG